MNPRVIIENGILKIDGQPTFVWSADYPYYRDQAADWPKQLDNLKKMNVNVVTFYLSWRHHAPVDPLLKGGSYDFTGKLNDRTNVLEFIRLVRERGMHCIVKPGPYIHAETRFGSLPDYVLPQNNPEIPVRTDMQGNPAPACWGFERPPSPLNTEYLKYVENWFRAVARDLIAPNQFPHGPIVAVQVLNEGIYSDGSYAIDKLHFEEDAVEHYQKFLSIKYGTIENYNRRCGTIHETFLEIKAPGPWAPGANRASVRPWIDWAEFGQYYYRLIAGTYIRFLRDNGVSLPMVMNINPPAAARGPILETVMGRYNIPDLSPLMSYGYTNWCGVVQHNPDAYLKYKFIGKLARGINMEENWGFDSYDPPHYWSVQPSFFQSMAYMLWGATGLNIYLGVSCDCWTDTLAIDAGGVYMHNHPISEDGNYRSSFWTCQQMGALMKHVGNDLVAQDLHEPVGWALYTPYAHAGSWESSSKDWKKAGFSDIPRAAWFGWDSFMALCDKNKTQNGITYPREESVERLGRFPILFIDGGDWMDTATQRKLVAYVENGGTLVVTSRAPDAGEFFEPCTILRDTLFPCEMTSASGGDPFSFAVDGGFKGSGRGERLALSKLGKNVTAVATAMVGRHESTCGVMSSLGKGRAIFLGFSPWQTEVGEWGATGLIEHLARRFAKVERLATILPKTADPLVEIAEFRSDARKRRYVYVLTRNNKPRDYEVSLAERTDGTASFAVQLPAFSGALVGLEDDRIAAAFVKGYNDLDKSSAAPRVMYGDRVLSAMDPCDLYFCRRDDGHCEVSVVNVQNGEYSTRVTLPFSAAQVKEVAQISSSGRRVPVKMEEVDGRSCFTAVDMRSITGGEFMKGGEWSPCYLVTLA